jgi:hypothetical protein
VYASGTQRAMFFEGVLKRHGLGRRRLGRDEIVDRASMSAAKVYGPHTELPAKQVRGRRIYFSMDAPRSRW